MRIFLYKIGHQTGDHIDSSVSVIAEGAGALLFFGYCDQIDVFFKMKKILTTNTTALDSSLR